MEYLQERENEIIAEQKRKEEQQKKQLEKEEKDKEEKDKEQIDKLLNYFLEKESCEAIPLWAVNLDKDIIGRAKEEYHKIQSAYLQEEQEKERLQEIEKKAIELIVRNHALPSNYHNLKHE